MSEIQIIEDLIPKKLQDEIENWISSAEVDWRYLPTPSPNIFLNDLNIFHTWQLSHAFYLKGILNDSPKFRSFIIPMLFNIKLKTGVDYSKKLLKIKANTLLKNIECTYNNYNIPHVDTPKLNNKSLLYYINDSDGDTFIFNETAAEIDSEKCTTSKLTLNRRITPKKGTAIIFNSNRYHASSSPKNTDRRFVINFVFSDGE